jgi:hypothetical protein
MLTALRVSKGGNPGGFAARLLNAPPFVPSIELRAGFEQRARTPRELLRELLPRAINVRLAESQVRVSHSRENGNPAFPWTK